MSPALYPSPLGPLAATFDGEALVSLRFVDAPADAQTQSPADALKAWLDTYFSGHEPPASPPLDLRGTGFQRRVWHELLKIPYGSTVSYGELARRTGCRSAQAVGQAVGRNPVAILVPCHRVVGKTSLGGYAYGLHIKKQLLDIERQSQRAQ
ncbi:MAG: methylated-DNA--[protein]-cysteine S-methyltransferase [Bacteroidales bacterium]|nr:methylated-DNA--[protein]-cysteine S-methyltransferase [Bacteroidales bacterium]